MGKYRYALSIKEGTERISPKEFENELFNASCNAMGDAQEFGYYVKRAGYSYPLPPSSKPGLVDKLLLRKICREATATFPKEEMCRHNARCGKIHVLYDNFFPLYASTGKLE